MLSTIVANTAVPTTSSEYTTSDTAKNASFTPTSTALNYGDRIKVTLFVKNQGTMGGGFTVTNSYDGPTAAAAGDTYVTFTENLFPAYSGGPQGWSSPAGTRAVYVRTGVAMASLIPLPSGVTPPVILTTSLPAGITGQPYSATLTASGGVSPYTWSISSGSLPAGLSLNVSTGVISGTPASPPGTASFTVKVTDSNSSTATQPLSVTTLTVYAPQGPVRARLPQLQPRAGRVYSNPGAPLRNPGAGPVFRAQGLIRIRVQPPLRGRIYATIKPAPVIIPPVTGPRVYPLEGPVQAKLLLPRRGICRAAGFFPGQLNPQSGPAFRQADTPARIRIALAPRGRIASGKGGPVENPVPPVTAPFRQTAAAVRIRPSLPLRGRVYSGKGAPVRNPGTGPVFRLPDGAQARIPLPRRGMCRTIKFYPLPSVPPPHPGPVVYPLTAPVRAPFRPPPRGRIGSNSGMVIAVIPPPHPGPVFYPRNFAKPQQPLPRRGTCRTIKFYSLIGTIEGVFVQAPKPARIRRACRPEVG